MVSELFSSPRVSGRNVQENVATAISGLIDSRSKSAASGAERRQQGCHAPDDAALRDQLDQAEASLFPSDGGGKIIRLYPRATFRDKPALPVRDKNVIRLSQIASMPQKGARQQTSSQSLSPIAIVGANDDYHRRMLENALAAAVLAVLVIAGNWIVSILAAIR